MYGEFTLVVSGDAMVQMPAEVLKNDPGFMSVVKEVRQSDAAFTNIGVNVYARGSTSPAATSGNTWITANPSYLKGLQWMGFNLMGAADNHAYDYGMQGILDTLHALQQLDNVAFAGIGETLGRSRGPAYLFTPHGRVGFINCVSTFQQSAPAGDPRPDVPGRPGVNPLRHLTLYNVDEPLFTALQKYATTNHIVSNPAGLAKVLPTGSETVNIPTAADPFDKYSPVIFRKSTEPGIETHPDATDVKEMSKSIADAKVMADYVVTSIHAHEGAPGKNTAPAQFLIEFAHSTIDAGSDVFVGDGPEQPKGIEIYKGKPIFYSVGVLFYQNELSQGLPSDFYDRYGLGPDARPSDAYKARGAFAPRSSDDPRYWTFIGKVIFKNRKPTQVILTPVQLSIGEALDNFPDRGIPRVATGEKATKILQYLQQLSQPFGTTITVKDGLGIIDIK
jgi:poly-gamma-glutamate capsule biosynthesis protein CapA/YwtB (metallophosphatase superfamily)